tara:strand:+ start:178 stop:300 length:123 start_codon:yes stop_codon:yes gene_type:complete
MINLPKISSMSLKRKAASFTEVSSMGTGISILVYGGWTAE